MIDALGAWWAEWSSYRPSDFLMFSPRIYWRLFDSLNTAAWPAQGVLIGAPLLWLAGLPGRWRGLGEGAALRAAALVLALCWAVVAWCFLAERFAPINWPATGFALAFAMQGLGSAGLALVGGLRCEARTVRWRVGIALALWALVGHPLLTPAFGRPWAQAEVFGLAPDPTAIGALAFLLLVDANALKVRRLLRALWVVPIAWCAVSAATLATMGSVQAWVVLAAGTLGVAAAIRR